MNEERIRRAVLDQLAEIAPEADLGALEPDEDLREQMDLDSMDILNFLIGVGEALEIEIPEVDYPKLVTLEGCVSYLSERVVANR